MLYFIFDKLHRSFRPTLIITILQVAFITGSGNVDTRILKGCAKVMAFKHLEAPCDRLISELYPCVVLTNSD